MYHVYTLSDFLTLKNKEIKTVKINLTRFLEPELFHTSETLNDLWITQMWVRGYSQKDTKYKSASRGKLQAVMNCWLTFLHKQNRNLPMSLGGTAMRHLCRAG